MDAETYAASIWRRLVTSGWPVQPAEWCTCSEPAVTNGTPTAIVGLLGDGI